MEAETVEELPAGAGWQFDLKNEGFRCLAHRRGIDNFRAGSEAMLSGSAGKVVMDW